LPSEQAQRYSIITPDWVTEAKPDGCPSFSARTQAMADIKDYLSGYKLYGDDFDEAAITAWYASEAYGYYNLVITAGGGSYGYHALNSVCGFSFLPKRRLDTCLTLGCASGEDVAPLAAYVSRFIAIEPAEKWWRSEIGGRPAEFMKPTVLGDIALPSASVDLVTSFGVLHHIANVGRVLGELGRVLRPGGLLLLREPIHSMGDWRQPRRGLTKNERGIPIRWLHETLTESGLRILQQRYCQAPTTWRLARLLGQNTPYGNAAWVYFDLLVSAMLRRNAQRYHRTGLQKLAPGSVFIVAERRS
jgi:SAM-dependent methyltransferase